MTQRRAASSLRGAPDRPLTIGLLAQLSEVTVPYGLAVGHRVDEDSCGGGECAHHRELARLRRDLHDGLGPSLAGIMVRADLLAQLMTKGDQGLTGGREVLQELRQEASAFLAEMRRVLSDREPAELDRTALADALPAFGQRISAASGGRLSVRVDVAAGVDAADRTSQVAAFWIVREALTNVVKHARATACAVRVWVNNGLRLSVVDDGHGGLTESGMGLGTMRGRAAEFGGWCDVVDTGHGVAVTAHLPEGRVPHDRAA
ncbi:sensor histidine kinase [Actinophytocola sp.]|uniref:sensor histidine kinase n=1 Tax=Actinophytocola sp. TaxID=1872138 RepID=UPI00389A90E9